jgi:hypothetical protein
MLERLTARLKTQALFSSIKMSGSCPVWLSAHISKKEVQLKFKFTSGDSTQVGSTEFAKQLLSSALQDINPSFAQQIVSENNWRKNYQAYFLQLADIEFGPGSASIEFLQSALNYLGGQLKSESGETMQSIANRGFASKGLVSTHKIQGSGSAAPYWFDSTPLTAVAESWVRHGLAEPAVIQSFSYLQQNTSLPIADDLLVALAGNAELSFAKDWLSLGGRVAVVGRQNQTAWASLIAHAEQSAGTLFVPSLVAVRTGQPLAELAGLDLIDNLAEITSWIHELSRNEQRLAIASFAYVGGAKQIVTQAAQDCIVATVTSNLPKSKVALSWLATPLDVVVVGKEVTEAQVAKFASRSIATKLRDAIWQIFGQLKAPQTRQLGIENLVAFDASSVRQGSSYLLAKHSEKWRALLAHRQGNLVCYTVAPPATTRSVLGVKILNYTYRGLDRFGVRPFSALETRRAMALLLLSKLHDTATSARHTDAVALVSATAIHGGTWRLAYRPDSIWVPATVYGWFSRK